MEFPLIDLFVCDQIESLQHVHLSTLLGRATFDLFPKPLQKILVTPKKVENPKISYNYTSFSRYVNSPPCAVVLQTIPRTSPNILFHLS